MNYDVNEVSVTSRLVAGVHATIPRGRVGAEAGPSWEVYGHWYPEPAKLRTDIYYLLEA